MTPVKLRSSHGASVVVPWEFHGTSVTFVTVVPMEFLWASIVLPWDFHGTPVRLRSDFTVPMGLPWDFCGTSVGLPSDFAVPMVVP